MTNNNLQAVETTPSPISPQLSPQAIVGQMQLLESVVKQAMKENVHYGVVPGCGDKLVLLKAGAEKLCLLFRLSPQYDISIKEYENGHREYTTKCSLVKIDTGQVWAQGIGSCSTLESKYRYRTIKQLTNTPVPQSYWTLRQIDPISAQALLGGRDYCAEKSPNGKWFVACKVKIENPCIADVYNTVLKMAKKRAFVDATSTAVAGSDMFTQDIIDEPDENIDPQTINVVSYPATHTETPIKPACVNTPSTTASDITISHNINIEDQPNNTNQVQNDEPQPQHQTNESEKPTVTNEPQRSLELTEIQGVIQRVWPIKISPTRTLYKIELKSGDFLGTYDNIMGNDLSASVGRLLIATYTTTIKGNKLIHQYQLV